MLPYPAEMQEPGLFDRVLNAEKEGFEPPVPVKAHLISNQAHSTTLALLLAVREDKAGKVRRGKQGRPVIHLGAFRAAPRGMGSISPGLFSILRR